MIKTALLSAIAAAVMCLVADSALAADGHFLLLRAQAISRTMRYTRTYPASWDADNPPGTETVLVGGYFKGRFRIHEVLAGKLRAKQLTLRLTMATELADMPQMFLLVDNRAPNVTAVWWGYTRDGFCLLPQQVQEIGLADAAAAAAREYPCKPER